MDKAIMLLKLHMENREVDIEVPVHISAKEFVLALNEAYDLRMEVEDISKCCLRSENPIALLKGDKTLHEYGLRNGTVIHVF